MSTLLTAAAIMTGLSLFFGVVLATAYRYLKVEEDPRIDLVEEMLPGANCGACGQPGCRAFAEKVVSGTIEPSACTVSSLGVIGAVARLLGVQAGVRRKRVARLHCAGGKRSVVALAEYQGIPSCRAAAVVNGGGIACAWGCLGLADCQTACTFSAIRMNSEGLPVVSVDRCTACGDCVDACPRDLFSLEYIEQKLIVQCASPLRGDAARSVCKVACDACGRCALDAGSGVIEMVDGLPVIRSPEKGTIQATLRCPTGAIQWVEGEQFQYDEEPSPSQIGGIRV